MDTKIAHFSDETAINILTRLPAAARSSVASPTAKLSAEQRRALAAQFEVSSDLVSVSGGELARQALQLLGDDIQMRQAIHIMADNMKTSPERFDGGATILLGTAVMMVLQTYLHFERDKDGKWTIEIRKEPTDESLLKPFVAKLLAFLPGK